MLVAGVILAALLYYKPVHSYLQTKDALARRSNEVHRLEVEKSSLDARLAGVASEATLVRRARRIGLVKPGERLFIVKGISAWRQNRRSATSAR